MILKLRRNVIALATCALGIAGSAFGQYTPTISGANAFWWLGSGILSDGGTCSGQTGPCYYAQSQLTSNPNGAPGSPSWTVVQNGQGQVSLSCYTCANPVATAQSTSNGCYSDIQIYVSYGGYSSNAFNVTIVSPSFTNLQSGYPQNATWMGTGYLSTYQWQVVDSCGNADSGIDANEVLGTYTNIISNNWSFSTGNSVYMSTSLINDGIGHVGGTPAAEPPQSPLTSTEVRYDYPWALRVGSQTGGSGTPVGVDHQVQWLDHGTHQ